MRPGQDWLAALTVGCREVTVNLPSQTGAGVLVTSQLSCQLACQVTRVHRQSTTVHPVLSPHVSHCMLAVLAVLTLEPLAQSVLVLHLGRAGDGRELLHHAVPSVGSLDGVGRVRGGVEATVAGAQHLHLFVQQVLGELVGLGHLGPAQTFPAWLFGRQVRVLSHAAPGSSRPHQAGRVESCPGSLDLLQGTFYELVQGGGGGGLPGPLRDQLAGHLAQQLGQITITGLEISPTEHQHSHWPRPSPRVRLT